MNDSVRAPGAGQRQDAADDDPIRVEVVHDGRLRTRIHWEWNGARVLIRVPKGLSQREADRHVVRIVEEVKRKRARVRARADADLEALGREINRTHFDGELSWHSIRWVSNMHQRVGSCTNGGPTDGDIRISSRVKGWPRWVVEYVVAHELAHRKHPNHGAEFWRMVQRLPKAERAIGFLTGVAFQLGEDAEEWL
jgi:predicted metal-dependent hydrolase